MRVGDDGWLVVEEEGFPAVVKAPSVRTSAWDNATSGKPLGICWHWTAGKGGTPNYASALADSIRTFDSLKDRAASWHVLIAKDGRIFQSVPFIYGSWHVGKPGRIGGAPVLNADGVTYSLNEGRLFGNVNRALVGVELENAGNLQQVNGRYYCWPYWLNPDVVDPHRQPDPALELPAERVALAGSTWYDVFPQAQQDAAARLLAALVQKYGWKREVSAYGHVMFDYPRKVDPGPLWLQQALPAVLSKVFGNP